MSKKKDDPKKADKLPPVSKFKDLFSIPEIRDIIDLIYPKKQQKDKFGKEFGLENTIDLIKIPEEKIYLKNNFSKIINLESNLNNIIKKDFLSSKYENKNFLKNSYSIIEFNNYISKNISKSHKIKSFNAYSKGFTMDLNPEDSVISAENLAEFAHPIVEYIRATNPDYIIACDRGARLLGVAIHRLHQELYGSLPTTDGSIRFRRISKSVSEDETTEMLRPLADEILRNRDKPRVLVLDDWVVSGATKDIVERVLGNLTFGQAEILYGVMVGGGADISGNANKRNQFAAMTDWRDDPKIIGVDYAGIRPIAQHGREHIDYRRRISEGVIKYAARVKAEQAPPMHYATERTLRPDPTHNAAA